VHASSIVLQDASLLDFDFFGKTVIVAWLLMTTTKDQSTHSEYLILIFFFSWNICMLYDSSCHNANKDGYQNIDSPCVQIDCNVGILYSDTQLEHVKLRLLEGIQHL
jgi:hypothetical protein